MSAQLEEVTSVLKFKTNEVNENKNKINELNPQYE